MLILILFCIGLIAGLLVGLLGVGATLVLLPTLILLLPHILASSIALKSAVGTTLACTTLSVCFASYLHIRKGNVIWPICSAMMLIYLVTSFTGALFVHWLPAQWLELIFGCLLIVLAIKLIIKIQVQHDINKKPNCYSLMIATLLAGFANSMTGIGTGNIMIPYLSRYFNQKNATATSLTATVVACSFGTLSYMYLGWGVATLPKFTLGYLYLPAFIPLSFGILIATPVGYRLSWQANKKRLRVLLASLIFLAGIAQLIKLL